MPRAAPQPARGDDARIRLSTKRLGGGARDRHATPAGPWSVTCSDKASSSSPGRADSQRDSYGSRRPAPSARSSSARRDILLQINTRRGSKSASPWGQRPFGRDLAECPVSAVRLMTMAPLAQAEEPSSGVRVLREVLRNARWQHANAFQESDGMRATSDGHRGGATLGDRQPALRGPPRGGVHDETRRELATAIYSNSAAVLGSCYRHATAWTVRCCGGWCVYFGGGRVDGLMRRYVT